jgi:hypothetical protein
MIVMLSSLEDFTLASFAAVARGDARVQPSESACGRIDARRASSTRHIDSISTPLIYNLTGKSDVAILDAQGRRVLRVQSEGTSSSGALANSAQASPRRMLAFRRKAMLERGSLAGEGAARGRRHKVPRPAARPRSARCD